ncbi:MAG TPA: hypothetical protein VMU11_03070 [Verrucomicrobiae bacterium]|nr:hypothetical protein [Verrucomicrobiae bacterium]
MKNQKMILIGGAVLLIVAVFIGLGMWFAGHVGSGGGKTVAKTDTQIDHLTYTSDQALVPQAVADHIAKVDPDRLTFDGKTDVSSLPVGQPLMFPGKAVRRINHVAVENGKTVIYTDPAKLNEVIKDAKIDWNQHFSFANMPLSELERIKPVFGGTALAQTGTSGNTVEFSGEISDWNVTVSITPDSGQNRLDISLDARKGSAGRVHADGYITDFTSRGGLQYSDSNLDNFTYEEQGLQGRLHVIFAAVELGSDEALFNIPAEISIPYEVGPLYMEAKLKADLRVVPEVRGGASAQADFTVTYGSDRGFSFEGGQVTPLGQLNNQDVAVTGDTVSAGTIATGMGVGIEFPRLELAMYGETIVPYLSLDNYTYTVYTPDPPCQEGGLRQRAVAGLTLSFLGAEYSRETELWKRESVHELPGSHCDNPDHPDSASGN